jgi:hypothetical protein
MKPTIFQRRSRRPRSCKTPVNPTGSALSSAVNTVTHTYTLGVTITRQDMVFYSHGENERPQRSQQYTSHVFPQWHQIYAPHRSAPAGSRPQSPARDQRPSLHNVISPTARRLRYPPLSTTTHRPTRNDRHSARSRCACCGACWPRRSQSAASHRSMTSRLNLALLPAGRAQTGKKTPWRALSGTVSIRHLSVLDLLFHAPPLSFVRALLGEFAACWVSGSPPRSRCVSSWYQEDERRA